MPAFDPAALAEKDKAKEEKQAAKQRAAEAKKAAKKAAKEQLALEDKETRKVGEKEKEGWGLKKARDVPEEEEEELEATEEELLEEEQDAKVRFIQRAYRSRRARRLVRELVRSNFTKEYDAEEETFYYRNKRTGARQESKPLFLGDEDLPDPKVYLAPRGYSTRPSKTRQLALVIHCTRFQDPKLFNLPAGAEADHEALCSTLVNPFMAKFREQDCVFASNPTRDAAVGALETLRSLAAIKNQPQGGGDERDTQLDHDGDGEGDDDDESVVCVYLCTYVAHVTKGRHRGAYVCFSDTNLGSAGLLKRTALPLEDFCHAIAQIDSPHKTVFLDVAHALRPKDTLLKVVLLYPPSNLYADVAKRADCRVVGACKLGPQSLSDTSSFAVTNPESKNAAESQNDPQTSQEKTAKSPDEGKRAANTQGGGLQERDLDDDDFDDLDDDDENGKASSKKNRCVRMPKLPLPRLRLVERTDCAPGEEKYYVLDEIDEIRAFPSRARARLTVALRDARHRARERNDERKARRLAEEKRRIAEYEVALYGAGHSLFGGALIRALRGHASHLPEQRISVGAVFEYVARDVPRGLTQVLEDAAKQQAALAARARARGRPEPKWASNNNHDAPPTDEKTPLVLQTPQAFAGKNAASRYSTLASVPSPPPAPRPPKALKVRDRTVLLTWEDPPFSGVPPIQYEISYRGSGKFDSRDWFPCATFATITTNRFNVPHLVPGMTVRFRVRARNHGGWGEWSESSEPIVPQTKPVTSIGDDIRRAATTGIPALLEAMRRLWSISDAQKLGIKQLIAYATRNGGFKRAALAKDSAVVVLQAMRTYVFDADMQSRGALLLGGWCFLHPTVVQTVGSEAARIFAIALEHFHFDVSVVRNVARARRYLPVPEDPPKPADTSPQANQNNNTNANIFSTG